MLSKSKKLSPFALRVYELRKQHGLSQERLSTKADVPLHDIRNYEQCKNENYDPNATYLLRLAEVFDVTPEYLLLGEEPMIKYMDELRNELIKLSHEEIKKYSEMPLADKVLAHLKLSENFIHSIKTAWDQKCKVNFNIPYVQKVIIHYCHNRPSKSQ